MHTHKTVESTEWRKAQGPGAGAHRPDRNCSARWMSPVKAALLTWQLVSGTPPAPWSQKPQGIGYRLRMWKVGGHSFMYQLDSGTPPDYNLGFE